MACSLKQEAKSRIMEELSGRWVGGSFLPEPAEGLLQLQLPVTLVESKRRRVNVLRVCKEGWLLRFDTELIRSEGGGEREEEEGARVDDPSVPSSI